MITPIAALCLSLFGLLCGLVAARYMLIRSLSAGGKHLSQLETFIENIPTQISSTTGGIVQIIPGLPSPPGTAGAPAPESTSTPVSVSGLIANSSIPQTAALATSMAPSVTPADPALSSGSLTIANAGAPATAPTGALAMPVSLTTQLSTKLTPAEIAYLIRGGDLNHTLIVVAVDLIQRAIKSQDTTFSEGLADYEKNMWRIVSRSVKDWATQKVQQTIISGAKNPVAAMRRFIILYNFIGNSLRGLIADTIADPRRLKKYFSPYGVIRIITDFTSSGYKQTFQEELRKSLLKRGLLVPEKVRNEVGTRFFIIGVTGVFLTLVASFYFLPGGTVALATWFSSLIAGTLGRTLLALRHMVPFYEELAVVAEQIRRKSFRVSIVKGILRSINALSWLALFISVTICVGIGFGIIKLAYPAAALPEFAALIALTVTHFAVADFVFNGIRLNIDECPTRIAEKQLEEMRKELEHVSPLDSFSTVLASPDYDPTFSKILALYGIETLLILL